jgi:hypothetical protein
MGAINAFTDARPMHQSQHKSQPRALGVPALLVVSLASVTLVVLAIALVGATNEAWAVGLALIVHAVTTAAVVVASSRMLDNADRSID